MQASRRYLLIVAFIWFCTISYLLLIQKTKQDNHDDVGPSNDAVFFETDSFKCKPRVTKPNKEDIFQKYWGNSKSFEMSTDAPSLQSHNFVLNYEQSKVLYKGEQTKPLIKVLRESEIGLEMDLGKQHTENEFLPNFIDNSSLLAMRQYIRNRGVSSPLSNTYDFVSCRMSTCFDFRRCNMNNGLRVHLITKIKTVDYSKSLPSMPANIFNVTAPNSLIYTNMLDIIRRSSYYEPDPSKACLFVPESHTLDRDPLSGSFQDGLHNMIGKHNDYGINYLIFNLFSGSWPDYRENDYTGLPIGAAILAKASISHLHYRPGFDISLPLFNISHPIISSSSSTRLPVQERMPTRRYLLSFKGKRYTVGNGSETRNSLYHLHNDRDVIMLTTCRHGKKWREMKDRRCDEDNRNYDNYDYQQLMRESSFCLIPRGRRLGSYRFLEALYNDCIPVILSNGWIKPFDNMIDWSQCVIQIDERLVLQVPDLLRGIHNETRENMRTECNKIYNKYLSSMEQIVMSTFKLIEKRLKLKIS